MGTPFVDHSGKVFNFWTVLNSEGRDRHNQALWRIQCVCGVEKVQPINSIRRGDSKSCGCQSTRLRVAKLVKHGKAGTPEYKSFRAMHSRCQGKGGSQYKNKGITVDERWKEFDAFFADMGHRPQGTTLDRIDNNKGYGPDNCRWATSKEQQNNRSVNVRGMVCGESLTVAEAAQKYERHISGVRHRIRKGWTLEEAVLIPHHGSRPLPNNSTTSK